VRKGEGGGWRKLYIYNTRGGERGRREKYWRKESGKMKRKKVS
jgi:hypothetical protein